MNGQTPDYAEYPAYRELVALLGNAGITVSYGDVWADSIDGDIWARTDAESRHILMPAAADSFTDSETATVILGHEAAHILLALDSPDAPADRCINEAQCDYVGGVLFKLAEMTAGARAERELMRYALEQTGGQ